MNPGKAPSLDGFATLFYLKYWNVVKSEVTKTVLEFLNNKGIF